LHPWRTVRYNPEDFACPADEEPTMPDAVTHPTPQELAAYGLGKLPEDAAAAVARHLETCAVCGQAVAELSADSFLAKVHAARPGGTPFPAALPGPSDATRLPGAAAPAAACPNLPPELADHPKFLILRELGRGGMGIVYQARHKVMNRQIVIKVVNPSLLAKPGALERFDREVKAAAQLCHPNIVTAFDAEQAGDWHLLVMEFVPGQSLAEVLDRKGPLPVARACRYMCQVALALQHAFERGLVHRDVKPANLIVTPKGQVKMLDFGLAKMVSESAAGRGITALGAYMGTPEYSAPEQAWDASTADIRADLYSLGCTLYCLLAGRPPFREDTAVLTILAHQEKAPLPLPQLRPDVPEELWQVIARLLAKGPADRYQTPAEVARALAPFVKGHKSAPVSPPPIPPRAPAPGGASVLPQARSVSGIPGRRTTTEKTDPFRNLTNDPASAPTRDASRSKRATGLVALGIVFGLAAATWLLAAILLKVGKSSPIKGGLEPVEVAATKPAAPPEVPPPPSNKPPENRKTPAPPQGKATAPVPSAKPQGVPPAAGEPNSVDQAIHKGVAALRRMQRANGDWPYEFMGATALAGLALLECGVISDDPAVVKAADFVRQSSIGCTHTYSAALAILFLDRLGEAGDVAFLESLAVSLLAGQGSSGGWTYQCPPISAEEVQRLTTHLRQRKEAPGRREGPGPAPNKRTIRDLPTPIQEQLAAIRKSPPPAVAAGGDNSNTQFAALALWVARRYGIPVDGALARLESRFRKGQMPDGGWPYVTGQGGAASTATMTCAGVLALEIADGFIGDARKARDPAKDQQLAFGLTALARCLNPIAKAAGKDYYFLGALERVCLILDLKTLAGKDWYNWGSTILLASQGPDGLWRGDFADSGADTCFALLFLKRSNLASDLTSNLQAAAKAPAPAIPADGGRKTKEFNLSGFTAVDVRGLAVEITRADSFKISVTAEENVVPCVVVARDGDRLDVHLDAKGQSIQSAGMKVVITMPALAGVRLSGGARATCTGFKGGKAFVAELPDGQLEGNVEAGKLQLHLRRASSVRLRGSATEATIEAEEASQAWLTDFVLDKADVVLGGASGARLNVKTRLDYTLSGASRLTYRGKPTVGRDTIQGAASAAPEP
jgi:serine/threonine protein kinase